MKILIIVVIILVVIAVVVYRGRNKGNFSKSVISGIANLGIETVYLGRELSFTSDVVGYFKSLHLDPQKDTPFIIDGMELAKHIKDVPNAPCLFMGVLEDNEISNYRLLCADSFDAQTKEVLAKAQDGIVVLS